MRNKNAYHAPLHPLDAKNQTMGCRHTNPDICSSNSLLKVCALVRDDKTCLKPPRTWAKQFEKLKAEKR
jgi:hypothetical protein